MSRYADPGEDPGYCMGLNAQSHDAFFHCSSCRAKFRPLAGYQHSLDTGHVVTYRGRAVPISEADRKRPKGDAA